MLLKSLCFLPLICIILFERSSGQIVKVNGKTVKTTSLPTIDAINEGRPGGVLDYIEGSRTWDTSRFRGNLPYTLRFTDRYNNRWEVTLQARGNVVNMAVPCGTEMYWQGDVRDRTGSDAQTQFASLTFSYAGSSGWGGRAGIRIAFTAYKYKNIGEFRVDTQRWNTIIENVQKGVDIAQKIKDLFSGSSEEKTNGLSDSQTQMLRKWLEMYLKRFRG